MGGSNWSLQDNTDHGLFRLMEDTFIALLSVNSISTLALLATPEARTSQVMCDLRTLYCVTRHQKPTL